MFNRQPALRCDDDLSELLFYIFIYGILADLRSQSPYHFFEQPVVVQDHGNIVKIAHSLNVKELFPDREAGLFMKVLIHNKLGKVDYLCLISPVVSLCSFFKALDPAQRELVLGSLLVDHDDPFSVDTLHVGLVRQLLDRAPDGVSGTAVMLDQCILGGEVLLCGIGLVFNFFFQIQIDLCVFLCRHNLFPVLLV